jgi:hypothetical protein
MIARRARVVFRELSDLHNGHYPRAAGPRSPSIVLLSLRPAHSYLEGNSMKHLIAVAVLVLLLAPTSAHAQALTDSTAVKARAHELTPYVSQTARGRCGRRSTPICARRCRDSLSFARTLDAIHVTVGILTKTLSEVTQGAGCGCTRRSVNSTRSPILRCC